MASPDTSKSALAPRDALTRNIGGFPDEALSFFRSAFSIVAVLGEDARKRVFGEMVANFRRGRRRVDGAMLTAITGLSSRDCDQIASVYTVVIALLSETGATPDEFVEIGRGKLFTPQHEHLAREIAVGICEERGDLNASIEQAKLAGLVLPSLDSMETTVDLRLRITEGKVTASVPVTIVHIATDAGDEGLWLQLTRSDVEDMIKKLQDCLAGMSAAERIHKS